MSSARDAARTDPGASSYGSQYSMFWRQRKRACRGEGRLNLEERTHERDADPALLLRLEVAPVQVDHPRMAENQVARLAAGQRMRRTPCLLARYTQCSHHGSVLTAPHSHPAGHLGIVRLAM